MEGLRERGPSGYASNGISRYQRNAARLKCPQRMEVQIFDCRRNTRYSISKLKRTLTDHFVHIDYTDNLVVIEMFARYGQCDWGDDRQYGMDRSYGNHLRRRYHSYYLPNEKQSSEIVDRLLGLMN